MAESPTEKIKKESRGLRGTIKESLSDELTGSLREDDQSIIKFHGMYQQDDRDRRDERAEKKLERLYSYMIRLRLPGGLLSADQWIAIHEIAETHSTGVIKITTRQTVQLHGIIKSHIKPTIKAFDEVKLDSIATCGDINRNVICSGNPANSSLHSAIQEYADKISQYLMPRTRAYYEIWLDEEKIADKRDEDDPLYQERYLPRKFKIAIAIPPNNDGDVFANDVGLIAIIEKGRLKGFNVAVGGGLSTTYGNPSTYPRLATVIGFLDASLSDEKILKTVYAITSIQRDFGNRSDRKLARLKYTVDNHGIKWFKEEVERRNGWLFEPAKPFLFTERGDAYGWERDLAGKWHYTLFIENGRVLDEKGLAMKSAILEIAKSKTANFRFTGNQNVIIADIDGKDKPIVEGILDRFGIRAFMDTLGLLRKNSMACVSLPTCPLALAEAQRYLPGLIDKLETLLSHHGLEEEQIVIRMTGCPNGCARPYLAEIGLIGTAPGRYNLHLGGDYEGTRLNRLFRESLGENEIILELDGLFRRFRSERNPKEGFGDFVMRKIFV